jgi:hypothetical protein
MEGGDHLLREGGDHSSMEGCHPLREGDHFSREETVC